MEYLIQLEITELKYLTTITEASFTQKKMKKAQYYKVNS